MILSFADFIGGFGSLCCCTYHCSNSIGSLAKCLHLLFKVVSYTTRLSGVAIIAAIAIAAFILSKVITRVAKKMQEYSKKASVATTIASLIGLAMVAGSGNADSTTIIIVFIVGFVVLPFLFAFLVESIRQKSAALGAKSATAATVVYLADTALKLAAFAYAIYSLITMGK